MRDYLKNDFYDQTILHSTAFSGALNVSLDIPALCLENLNARNIPYDWKKLWRDQEKAIITSKKVDTCTNSSIHIEPADISSGSLKNVN